MGAKPKADSFIEMRRGDNDTAYAAKGFCQIRIISRKLAYRVFTQIK